MGTCLSARPLRRAASSPARRGIAALFAGFTLGGLAACGGGGGGGGDGGGSPPITPPTTVGYTSPASPLETEVAMVPASPTVTGGAPDLFTISPALPAGLSMGATSGQISGTPTTVTVPKTYTVTATNGGGSAQGTINLAVVLNKSLDLSPKNPATFTDDDIRYFLGRTTFGAKKSEFDACKAAGIPATVDAMLTFADTTALENTAAGLLANTTDPAGLEGKFPSQQQVAKYWVYLMLNNPNPFQEVLAFFWHDHFASSSANLETTATHWMVNQTNLWRHSGTGNLRSLILAMARDPEMLFFLDSVINTKQAPNENFAREHWELFTLGVDNGYVQADIVQAAKAFTGYRVRTDPVTTLQDPVFDTTRHDPGSKTILGFTIPGQNVTDDFQAVVDITVDHRPVAEYICKKLFEHFCYEKPTSVPVDAMAAMLRSNGYELKPVLTALFKSEAFFCAKSKAGIAKGPVEELVGFCRSTGLTPIDPKGMTDPPAAPPNLLNTMDGLLANLTQRPTMPPSVNGWPVGSEWLASQNMLDRANSVLACIIDRTDQANANGGVDLASLLLPPGATSATTVDALAALLYVHLTPAERTQLITYLDTSYNKATGVVTASPFDPTNPTHVAERVRGLLYILAQHPTYAIR